jgi:glutathione S-transferase
MEATLYGSRLSPFVEKVARAMQLKAVPFRHVDLKSPTDLKKWNPKTGKMPVLDIDGQRHHDSTFILRKLDELVPEPALFSKDAGTAARQRLLEDWSDESLYWYMMGCRWAPENESDTVEQLLESAPFFLRPVGRLLFPRLIGGQARAQGLARLPLSTLVTELGGHFDELLVLLGDKPFFFSDTVGAADLALFGQMKTMKSGPTPQCEELISGRPRLAEFFRRVDETTQPKVQAPTAAGLKAA